MAKLYTKTALQSLGRADLQALCKKHGLKAVGTNASLAAALAALTAPASPTQASKRHRDAPADVAAANKVAIVKNRRAGAAVRRSTRRTASSPAGETVEEPEQTGMEIDEAIKTEEEISAAVSQLEPTASLALTAEAASGPLRRGRSSHRLDPMSTAARPATQRKASPSSSPERRSTTRTADNVPSPTTAPTTPSPPPSPPASTMDEAMVHSLIQSAVRSQEARLQAQQEELCKFKERVNKLESTMQTLNSAQGATKETISQLSQTVQEIQQRPPRPPLLRTLPEVEYPSSLAFHARIELRLEQELWQKERQKVDAGQDRPASPAHEENTKKPVPAASSSPSTTPPGSPPMGSRSPRRFRDNVLENADLPPHDVVWDQESEDFHNLLLEAMGEKCERFETPEPEELKRRPQRGHVRASGLELLKDTLNRSTGMRRFRRQLWRHETRSREIAARAAGRAFRWPEVPADLLPEEGEAPDPQDDSELFKWRRVDASTVPMAVEDEDDEDDEDADADADADDFECEHTDEQVALQEQQGVESSFVVQHQQQPSFELQNWSGAASSTELQMPQPSYGGMSPDMGFSMSTFSTTPSPVDQMAMTGENTLHGLMEQFGAQIASYSHPSDGSLGSLTMQAGGVQAQSGIMDMTSQGGGLCQQVVGYNQVVLNDGTQLHQQYAINTSLIPPPGSSSSQQSQVQASQHDFDALLNGNWGVFGPSQGSAQEQFAIDPRLMTLPSPSQTFDNSSALISSPAFDTSFSTSTSATDDPMDVDMPGDLNATADPSPYWDDSTMMGMGVDMNLYMDMSSMNVFDNDLWVPSRPQGSAREYDRDSILMWKSYAGPYLRWMRNQLRVHGELGNVAVLDPVESGEDVKRREHEKVHLPRYRARERTFHDKVEDLVAVEKGVMPDSGKGSLPGPPVWIDEPAPDPKYGRPGEYRWVADEERMALVLA